MAQEAPEVDALAVLVELEFELTRSLLLASMLVLLDELLFDDELELEEPVEGAELLEELELAEPEPPGMVSWSPG